MSVLNTIGYEPQPVNHPAYEETAVDISAGDVVDTLSYDGSRVVRNEAGEHLGQVRYLSDEALSNYERGETDLVSSLRVVRDVDGFRVKVSTNGLSLNPSCEWIPRTMVLGVNDEQTQTYRAKRHAKARQEYRIHNRKQETDMDVLLNDVVLPHARQQCNEVWSGGTVDPDEVTWFWNKRLRSAAGKAYYGSAVPKHVDGRLAVGLAPGYYYKHGVDELLAVVRHELIHLWQHCHPDCDGGMGHGPKFKQWLDDMDTHRHCKHW